MDDRESSQLESISTVSLSGTSVSLTTFLSLQRRVQKEKREDEESAVGERDGERGGEDRNGQHKGGNDGDNVSVKGRDMLAEKSSSVCQDRNELLHVRKMQKPTVSPTIHHFHSEVLDNIPILQQHFDLVSKIGEGTFSSVYLASLKGRPERKFALKHLVPTSASSRIENELKCLQSMGGHDNVIPLLTFVRHKDHVVLIMPYFPHSRFADYLPLMTPLEVRLYMQALLTALCNVHSHHIIHRDIKPSNFLYSRETRKFQLVDFGLAHVEPGHSSSSSSSSTTSTTSSFPPTHSAQPKTRSQSLRAAHSPLVTPPTSSSAHLTRTQHHLTNATTLQVHINGVSLIPMPSYQKRIKGRLQPQGGRPEEGGREKGERVTRRRGRGAIGSEGEKGRLRGRRREERECDGLKEDQLCPQRHKATVVCDTCMSRSHQNAPRAGTPGFRAPEVLLKCPNQATAVDIWSAGVIFLCLLTGRYPFFRAHDDLSALAQIILLRGSKECAKAARELGKKLVCEQQVEAVDLKQLCQRLRKKLHQPPPPENHSLSPACKRRKQTNGEATTATHCHYNLRSPQSSRSPKKFILTFPQSSASNSQAATNSSMKQLRGHGKSDFMRSWENAPDSAYDLLYRCLELNPLQRITAEQALLHPFFQRDPTR